MANIKLGGFATDNIQKASLSLLSDLGIEMNVRSEKPISIENLIKGVLGQVPKTVKDICAKINESYLVGIISDKIFSNEEENFDDAIKSAEQGKYNQMMVFAVDFAEEAHITRSEMATLTRALNRASKACPVVLVCRYKEDNIRFALSLCERTAYIQGGHTGEKAGKVNILRGINPSKPHTGHIRIIEDMQLTSKDKTFDAVYAKWFDVFDNEVLTNKFYEELKNWFFWALKPTSGVSFPNDISTDDDDQKYNPQNIIRLITRLIFVWFLKQKGLVPNELFERDDLDKIVKNFEPDNFQSSSYYRVILQNLFFATLNKKIEEREFVSDSFYENRNKGKHKIKTYMRHASDLKITKEEFINLMRPVPFMNNSIFECLDDKEQNGRTYRWDGFSEKKDDDQKQACVPNYLFFAEEEYVDLSKEYDRKSASSVRVSGLLNILSRYNFTVEENTPLDQDVALDPELLGKVFENLLAAYNPETRETVRKSTGSYYTPRPIVQYMVDESLIAHLKKEVPEVDEDKIRGLISYDDNLQEDTLDNELKKKIAKAILDCKVLDPACGSGAFPMGMLQQMSHLLRRVDADNTYWEKLVVDRAINDKSFVEKMNDEQKEARKKEIENVFRLSINYPDYARKLYLIENCIYGVDIQSIAVQISRLRFFISLLCEQKPSKDASNNYGIKPLPNLEMKFVCANSLVRLEHINEARELFANKEVLDLIDELKCVRHELFVVTDHHVKEKLLDKDANLRTQIALSTGDCFEKSIKEKIKTHEETVERKERELEIVQRKPANIQQIQEMNLFGETNVITINKTEKQIKDLKSDISYFKKKVEELKKSISEGRDKAVKLAKQLTEWNPYDQNLSSPFFDPEWMFGVKGKFDIMIGNPPWGAELSKKDKDYLKNAYEDIDSSTPNSFAYFIGLGNRIYSSALCYILPDSILVKDFKKTRMLLRNNLKEVVWFENAGIPYEHRTFKNVDHDVCILMVESKQCSSIIRRRHQFYVEENCMIETLSHDPKEDLFIDYLECVYNMKATDEDLSILRKLIKYTSMDSFLQCHEGIHTGNVRDKLFLREFEKGYKKLFYGGRAGDIIRPYYSKTSGWYVNYDEKLIDKLNGEYASLREETIFSLPKIYITRTGNPFKAFFDEDTYASNNFFSLQYMDLKVNTKENLMCILALINSKLCQYFIRTFAAPRMGNTFIETKILHILKFPVPDINKKWRDVISLKVNAIIQQKKFDLEADTSAEEREIDRLVYELYGLTEDEIKIVEGKN